MKMKYEESVEYKVLLRIKAIRSNVVLRTELKGLGSYRQISRALNKLINAKKIVKIGAGIFAKTYISRYLKVVLIKDGVDYTLREALKRLNIAYDPGSAEKKYNEGKSTQIPVVNIVRLKDRCRRRIAYGNSELIFEGKINAK